MLNGRVGFFDDYGCLHTRSSKQNSSDVISDYEWESGAEEPQIQYGEVYCATGEESGVLLTFITVEADDPQGASDLKEGEWNAFEKDGGQMVATDVLYCDGQECIYSYHAEQYPEIPCALLDECRFWATVWDWSGNEAETYELDVVVY